MINWQEVPFIRLLLPFLLGLLSAASEYDFGVHTSVLLGLLLFCFVIFFWFSRIAIRYRFRQISGIILLLLLYLLGQVIWRVQTPHYQSQHYINEGISEATFLLRVNAYKLSRSGKSQQIKLSILGLETESGILKRIKGQTFCYLPAGIKLEIGTCILAKGQLDTVPGPKHPGGFDFAKYMALQGIVRQFHLQEDHLLVLSRDPLPTLSGTLSKVSSRLQKRLSKALPESTSGLAIALVLGQKNQLDIEVRADYSTVGAMHVLAVSGMHVGIVAMGLSFLLRFWSSGKTYSRIIKGLIAVIGIWLFAFLTGGAPSVLRAATMFSLFTLGKQLCFHQNVWNIIAASALLMLCAQSRALFTVGFQLSYLAVVAIVYFQPRLSKLITLKNKLANYFWQLLTLGIAAQLGTAIVSIYYFHQFPVYFWLSGLIVVPLATIALLLGIGTLIFVKVPYLSSLLTELLHQVISIMNGLMAEIAQFPYSTIANLQISSEHCLLFLSLLWLSVLWLEFRQRSLVYLILGTTLLIGLQFHQQKKNWTQQNELLIYQDPKVLAFSLVQGQEAITFHNSVETHTKLHYAQSSYLQSRHIQRDSSINLKGSSGLIHWNDHQILVLQNRSDINQLPTKQNIDFLILGSHFHPKKLDFLQSIEVKNIYLHPSLSNKAQVFWETQLQDKGHVIKGAEFSAGFLYHFKS